MLWLEYKTSYSVLNGFRTVLLFIKSNNCRKKKKYGVLYLNAIYLHSYIIADIFLH
jgi:hypothetical protein